MSGKPTVVGPGTGVPEDFKVGVVRVSPAGLAYTKVLALAQEAQLFPMHRAGLGRLEETYSYQEQRWLAYADGGQIDMVLHSQNCLHGMLFVVRHRLVVRRAVFINPPFKGATLAKRFHGLACADDMAPGSSYIQRFRTEIELGFRRFRRGLQRNPNYHLPECHILGLKHDRVLDHWSPHWRLCGLVLNYSLGRGPCPPLEPWISWHELESDPHHLNVIRDQAALELIRAILDRDDTRTALQGVVAGGLTLARAA